MGSFPASIMVTFQVFTCLSLCPPPLSACSSTAPTGEKHLKLLKFTRLSTSLITGLFTQQQMSFCTFTWINLFDQFPPQKVTNNEEGRVKNTERREEMIDRLLETTSKSLATVNTEKLHFWAASDSQSGDSSPECDVRKRSASNATKTSGRTWAWKSSIWRKSSYGRFNKYTIGITSN